MRLEQPNVDGGWTNNVSALPFERFKRHRIVVEPYVVTL
jgi:hypothetical protein